MIGVSLQQLLDLQKVVLLSKFNSLVPLIQQDTAVNGFFNIASLNEALHGQLGDAERHEFLCKLFQDWGVFWKYLDEFLEVGDVF
jgi:hypothetical protein